MRIASWYPWHLHRNSHNFPRKSSRPSGGGEVTIRGEKLTDASLRGVGAGAATTCFASELKASKAARPVEGDISLVGVFHPPPICTYTPLFGAALNR